LSKQQRGLRTKGIGCICPKIRRGWLISRSWGLGLECSDEGKEASMALGVELFLLLELMLKGREISLKPLQRGNSR